MFEEGVITSVADANIGPVFGIGFAPWSSGVFQFVNQYGLNKFIARAEELAKLYGERFTPPALLMNMANEGKIFE